MTQRPDGMISFHQVPERTRDYEIIVIFSYDDKGKPKAVAPETLEALRSASYQVFAAAQLERSVSGQELLRIPVFANGYDGVMPRCSIAKYLIESILGVTLATCYQSRHFN